MQSFSTQGMPASARIGYWSDVASGAFAPVEIRPASGSDFNAELRCAQFGCLKLASVQSSPVKVQRTRRQAARIEDHRYLLHVQIEGKLMIAQEGREAILEQGDLVLTDNSVPYTLMMTIHLHHLGPDRDTGRTAQAPADGTRYCQLVALPEGTNAEPVCEALKASVVTLPVQLRRSLTWDQGKEMAAHRRFSIETGVEVYFCDPRSPWQRGSNENTNGLLRQYFPKGKSLAGVSQAELDEVARKLNDRPRQTLGFRTPAEQLTELIDGVPHTDPSER